MELQDLQSHWNALGSQDPLWAILSVPDKKNGQWNLADFLQTGQKEVERLVGYLRSLGHPIKAVVHSISDAESEG